MFYVVIVCFYSRNDCFTGFQGLYHYHSSILPIRAAPGTSLSEREIEFNSEFSSYGTVENVFAHIKHWAVCRLPFCYSDKETMKETHHLVWICAAAFVNRYNVPLRDLSDK